MHATHQLFSPEEAFVRLGQTRGVGCLVVVSAEEVVRIFVDNGLVVRVSSENGHGEKALQGALKLANASHVWIPGAEPPKKNMKVNISAFALKNAIAHDIRIGETGKVAILSGNKPKPTPDYYLIADDHPGHKLILKNLTTIIGRDTACDLILDAIQVSRRHCLMEIMVRGLHFRDLGSTNGTSVNGIPANEGFLNAGDHLEFGTFGLVVHRGICEGDV